MFQNTLSLLSRRSLAFSALVFGIVLFVSMLFINHEFNRIREDAKHAAFVNLLTLGARLEGEINAHLVILRSLKSRNSH